MHWKRGLEKNEHSSALMRRGRQKRKGKYRHARRAFWPSNSALEHKPPKKTSLQKNQSPPPKKLPSSVTRKGGRRTQPVRTHQGAVTRGLVVLTTRNRGRHGPRSHAERFPEEGAQPPGQDRDGKARRHVHSPPRAFTKQLADAPQSTWRGRAGDRVRPLSRSLPRHNIKRGGVGRRGCS